MIDSNEIEFFGVPLKKIEQSGGCYGGDGLSSRDWSHKSDALKIYGGFLILSYYEEEGLSIKKLQLNFYTDYDPTASVTVYTTSTREKLEEKMRERIDFMERSFADLSVNLRRMK